MTPAAPKLNELSPADRASLEAWLVEFDQAWTEASFSQHVAALPPRIIWRAAAIEEMVKIDLERSWAAGRPARVEDYVRDVPDLSPTGEVPLDLVLAECEGRRLARQPVDLEELLTRFPQQAASLRALIEARPRLQATADTMSATSPGQSTASMSRLARQAPELHERFGRYRILRKLGGGGMGTVYLAQDTQLNRQVALKVPHFSASDGSEIVERFSREARAAAVLSHPHICPVYDVGEVDGVQYLTMQYIDGRPLSELVSPERPLPPRDAATIVARLATALQAAHAHGIIHRDLKPSNVMVNARGEPMILDFGLARRIDAQDTQLTHSGSMIGTPAYMSPEQVRGDASVGPLADVYGLGGLMYSALTGRPPLEASNVVETLRYVLERDPTPPRRHVPRLDRDLETICLKCLEKDPRQRPQSAQEVADEITHYLNGEAIRYRPLGPLGRTARWCRRKPLAAAFAVALVSLAALLAVAGILASHAARATHLAALARQVESGLDAMQLKIKDVEALESLAAQIEPIEPLRAREIRGRVRQRLAGLIEDRLRAAELDDATAERLPSLIALLRPAEPELADRLGASLTARKQDWQTVFHLQKPFAHLSEILPPDQAKIVDQHLSVSPGKAPSAGDEPVWTLSRAAVDVRFEVVLEPDWAEQSRMGIAICGGGDQDYRLLLRPAADAAAGAQASEPALTFAAAKQTQRDVVAELWRGAGPLQRRTLSGQQLPAGPLRLTLERSGDHLRWQVAETAVEFFDPFPIASAVAGKFGFLGNRPLAVSEARAWRRTTPQAPGGLAAADALYAQQDYLHARPLYEAEVLQAKDPQVARAATYKQALCLAALGQGDQAAALWERLLAEQDQRWSPLAGCQLWVLRIRQKRWDDADTIFSVLSSRLSFAELAALAPRETRDEIVTAYRREFFSLGTVQSFNRNRLRNMERAAEVTRYLSPDGRLDYKTKFDLMRAYMYNNQLALALPLAEEITRERPDVGSYRNFVRLLCWNQRPQQALKEIDAAIETTRKEQKVPPADMFLYRARVLGILQRYEEAEFELTRLLDSASGVTPLADLHLQRGFLFQRRGNLLGARAAWRQGFEAVLRELHTLDGGNSSLPRGLIAGSLSGAASGEQLLGIAGRISSSRQMDVLRVAGSAVIDRDAVGSALQTMWTSPRGRDIAERTYVYETASLGERARLPVLLATAEYVHRESLLGDLSAEEELLIWQTTELAYRALIEQGSLSLAQATQALLAWKGADGPLGWGGLAPQLDAKLRTPGAYLLAHRWLRLGKQREAESLWRKIADDPAANPSVRRLAAQSLHLATGGLARLTIVSQAPWPVRLFAHPYDGEAVEIPLAAAGAPTEVDVPASLTRFTLDSDDPELALSEAAIDLPQAGRKTLELRWPWRVDFNDGPLSGLLPAPARLSDGSRWQLETALSRPGISQLSYNPDQTAVACSTWNGVIRVYDTEKWQLRRVLLGPPAEVKSLDYRRDGTLAVSYGDGSIRLWNRDGAPGLAWRELSIPSMIRWSPDGSQLATVHGNGEARLYTADGVLQIMLPEGGGARQAVSWHPQGKWLAVGGVDKTVQLFRPDGTAGPELVGHAEAIWALAFSPDGRHLASGSGAGTKGAVRIWSTEGQLIREVDDLKGLVKGLVWRKGSQELRVLGYFDGLQLVRLDGQDGRVPGIIGDCGSAGPKDDSLLFRSWGDVVNELAPDGKLAVRLRSNFNDATSLAMAKDGRIVIINRDRSGRLFDEQFVQRDRWQFDGDSRAVDVNPQNQAPAIAVGTKIRQFDSQHNQIWEITAPCAVHSLAWRPDGTFLAAGGDNGNAYVFAADGKLLHTLSGHTARVPFLAWHPAGQLLASAADDLTARIWNLDGGEPLVLKRYAMHGVTWSPDGQQLITASGRGVQAWSLEGKLLKEVNLDGGMHASALAMRRDGLLAVGQYDGKVNILDAGLKVQRTLPGSRAAVQSLAWSPDGKRLLATGQSLLRMWDAAEWQQIRANVLLPDNRCASFTAGGKPLDPTSATDKLLVYLVERADGGVDIVDPADFRQRIIPKPR